MKDDDGVGLGGVNLLPALPAIASSISVSTRRSERSLPHFVPIEIAYVLTVEKS